MNKHSLIFAALVAVIASSAHAATITVTGTTAPTCTLARAVALANALDATLDPPCVRLNDTPGVEDLVDTIVFAPGVGVLNVVPAGDTLSLKTPMVIDGGGRIILESTVKQRIFEVAALASQTVTLTGITLRGTLAPSGGVRVKSGKLVVMFSTFTANKASFGGALYVEPGASVAVSDSTFVDNVVSGTSVITVPPPTPACGQLPVVLGSTVNFAALGGSTVTSTSTVINPTIVNGDIGLSPGTAITGFPPGLVNGAIRFGTDPIAAQAKLDLTTAYNEAKARSLCSVTLTGDMGGMTLAPGLYHSETTLAITTADLTLDAQGDPNAVWIFQMGSTLTTTPGRQIILAGGAQAANIFWQVGTSATIGTNNIFYGTIMADQSITLNTGTHLIGRALARIAAVTLDTNLIDMPAPAVGAGNSGPSGETGSGIGSSAGAGFGVEGGAVDCFGTCSFSRVLFKDNIATGVGSNGSAFGGAIMAFNARLSVVNSTFIGNAARSGIAALTVDPAVARGGAIASSGGSFAVDFSTFSGNSASRGLLDLRSLTSGGALYLVPAVLANYTLYASIVSANTALLGNDCDLKGIAAGVDTQQSLFDSALSRTECAGAGVTNVVGVAALALLTDNGGATDTMRFGSNSPALNHVPTAACALAGAVDQRGYPRPAGSACDIGALELENIALDISGPTAFTIPTGATAPQTVTMLWSIDAPVPFADVAFSVTVSAGVTATILDVDGVPLAGCTSDGLGTTTCLLGDLFDGDVFGEIDFVFPASRTADITWSGALSFGFSDANPADDSDSGVIRLATCTVIAATDITCDGVDDNCNGAIDEGFVTAATSCGVGACAASGVSTCVAGVIGTTCVAGTPALTDNTCDNVDNDCDGSTDEGFAATATTCGVGVCAANGVSTCVAGVVGTTCVAGTPAASDATCNGLDNDCNGLTDEDFVAAPTTCGVGACAATGVSTCVAGAVGTSCVAGTPAFLDSDCDGVDDDCDGQTDEGFVPVARLCGDSCAGGSAITTCVAGRTVESACVPSADGAVCPSVGPCTLAAACLGGTCQVTRTRTCDDGNACTADRCDPVSGCASSALADGTACSDGNLCTTADTCQGGNCFGPAVNCAEPADCEQSGVCNVATGVCDYPFIPGCDPGCEPGADTTPPVLVCPIDKNAECINGGNTVAIGQATGRDDCGPVSITSDASASYALGETIVTFTGRDPAGNTSSCTTKVTVADNMAPIIDCPADLVVAGDAAVCGATLVRDRPSANDACDGAGVIVVGPEIPTFFPAGVTAGTYIAVDIAGNQAVCNTSVTVTGLDGFDVSCQATRTVTAPDNVCGWPEVLTAEQTSPCGEPTTLESEETLFAIGNTKVTFSAVDQGVTKTCDTVLTVVDSTLPTVACGAREDHADRSSTFTPTASDACGTTVTIDQVRCVRGTVTVSGRCEVDATDGVLTAFDAGANDPLEVMWTVHAVDPSGNKAQIDCRAALLSIEQDNSLFETGGGGCSGGGAAGGLAGLALLFIISRRRHVA